MVDVNFYGETVKTGVKESEQVRGTASNARILGR